MQHTGFVYVWYGRKKKWFCIGSRFGTTDDGYISSTGFLPKAYKKRPEDFKRRILDYYYGSERKELHLLEQKWLNYIKPHEFCLAENKRNGTTRYYNVKSTASGIGGEYASKLRKAYWESEKGAEHKKRLSEETTKRNKERKGKGLPAWNTGKKCPTISEGKKGQRKGLPTWNQGLKCPSISEGKLANPTVYTEEMRKKMSDAQRGKTKTEETKAKQSAALKGKKKSTETKLAMSAAAKERSARPRTCDVCGLVGNGPGMSRWHFKNCKFAGV